MSNTYGTTITEDRYTGSYSRGEWLAFPSDIDPGSTDAFSGDTECGWFWDDNGPVARRIGRGGTPDDAYADMLRRAKP